MSDPVHGNGDEGTPDANNLVQIGNKVDRAAADRLKLAIREAGGATSIARKSGVPLSTINNYVAGRGMKLPIAAALADATGVAMEWLANGRGPMRVGISQDLNVANVIAELEGQGHLRPRAHPSTDATGISPLNRFVSIPRYNIEASAGGGALVQNEQVVDYLAFDEDFIRRVIQRKVENLVLIEARGDSMDPTIRDSDLLLVDMTSGDRVENNGIYVLGLDDAILVKRIQRRLDGSMVVLSDNPRYAPETVSAADFKHLRIIGQVIWQAGPVRS